MASFKDYLQMQENLKKIAAPLQNSAIQSAALLSRISAFDNIENLWSSILEDYR